MIVIIDMQNDGYFHAPFNASMIELLPAATVLYLRETHLVHLLACLSSEAHGEILAKVHTIPRSARWPTAAADTLDLLRIAFRHRRTEHKLVVLSLGSTALAALLAVRGILKSTFVFSHSLDSITAKSRRAAWAVKCGAVLGGVFSRSGGRFAVIFQRKPEGTPPLVDLVRIGQPDVEVAYIPHPIARGYSARIDTREKRRFLYLGPPRPEKSPQRYEELAAGAHGRGLEVVHISSQNHPWRYPNVRHEEPVGAMSGSVRVGDIVFCAYDDAHYQMTESGTFLDALSVGAWAIVTKRRSAQLRSEFAGLIFYISVGDEYVLVKPKRKFAAALNRICRERVENIIVSA